MRVVVFGFGYWGKNHVRALTEDLGVETAVVEPDEQRRRMASSLFPSVHAVASVSELSQPSDAAVICTPPRTHRELAAAALDAGCHVLVEKPLAATLEDGLEMVAMAARSDRILMAGHIYDFHAATDHLEKMAAAGEFGQIRYLDGSRLSVGGYRSDVNVLWDMAPHDLVLMNRVLGTWPDRVTAKATDHSGLGVCDVATLHLEYADSPVIGYVRASWLDPDKRRTFTVVGSDRMAVFDDVASPGAQLRIIDCASATNLGEGSLHPLPSGYGPELVTSVDLTAKEPLVEELRYFLECIEAGSDPVLGSPADALGVLSVLEAADRSIRSGRSEAVQPVARNLGLTG